MTGVADGLGSGGAPGLRGRRTSVFVLVAGPPGSGKSTLALPLARELSLPLLAKDAIKDALIEVVGPPGTIDQSREYGRAAVLAMLTVARASPGAVLDSTFYPYTLPHLRALPGQLIEIRCVCPRDLVEARYRARSATRGTGHFDVERPPEELWNEHHLGRTGLGPLLEVDTTDAVDPAAVASQVRSAIAEGRRRAVQCRSGPGPAAA